jgi:glycosyltransferase involved in cell wall biosynthesis
LRIALVGTRGVPARYGGFETAIEEIGPRLVKFGFDVTVYCRHGDRAIRSHKGMQLVHLPTISLKATDTLTHTLISAAHAFVNRPDVVILFNAGNAPAIPLLRCHSVPVAVHVDGLEWKRSKWGRLARAYYRRCERAVTVWADEIISDAVGIQKYYESEYRAASVYLPYGAPLLEQGLSDRLAELGLLPGRYHLLVARFEPENNVLEALRGFVSSTCSNPLIVVGSAPFSASYVREIEMIAEGDERIRLLGGVWDQELLDQLFINTTAYIHGHSVGGTNPALLRAMGAGAPVVAFDVVFNREVAREFASYFTTPRELARQLVEHEREPAALKRRALEGRISVSERYRWDDVAAGYRALAEELVNRSPRRHQRWMSRRR